MTKLGSWADGECFYVSVVDGTKSNVIAGPYRTHEAALADVDIATRMACELDARGHWYAFGTVKMKNGYRDGLLNKQLMASVPMASWTGASIAERKMQHA